MLQQTERKNMLPLISNSLPAPAIYWVEISPLIGKHLWYFGVLADNVKHCIIFGGT